MIIIQTNGVQMLNKRSMDSFLREATALRSLNYIKAYGNFYIFIKILFQDSHKC